MSTVFLLTKPPNHPRAELCFKLIKRSDDARLYLCGDGIYCVLDGLDDLLPLEKIYVCKEDMDARGMRPKIAATMLDDFYEKLVNDLIDQSDRVLTF